MIRTGIRIGSTPGSRIGSHERTDERTDGRTGHYGTLTGPYVPSTKARYSICPHPDYGSAGKENSSHARESSLPGDPPMTSENTKTRHPTIDRAAVRDPETSERLNRTLTELTRLIADNRDTSPAQLAELVIAGLLTRGWRPQPKRRSKP